MNHLPLFFLTDFGIKDIYVGVMKSVVLSLGHRAPVVDLSHGIPPQDVHAAALALEDALPYLPEECVVCAVVDPGVGTSRRAIAARCGGRMFIAPDNGLLTPVYTLGDYMLREISPGGPVAPQRSATFHGRDVFAPAAALLATHARPWELIGPKVYFPHRLNAPTPSRTAEGGIEMIIVATDHFGNMTTNLRRSQIPAGIDLKAGKFRIGTRSLGRLRHTFDDVEEGSPVVYFNSSDRLEIGISMGNAALHFGAGKGAKVLFAHGVGK